MGIRDDTEVAVKDACVLGLVSLKREYSQLFVLFLEHGRIKGNTGDVHRRVGIVEGWNGPWYAGVRVTRAVLEVLDGPGW